MADERGGETGAPTDGGAPSSAGQLLRAARKAQGLHIAALAAALKVPQSKLEALEQDRHDRLPDATFARALAQSVCRVLKIDPAPVLAQMPRTDTTSALEQVSAGLGQPYRERAQPAESAIGSLLTRPVTWILLLIAVAIVVVWGWPWIARPAGGGGGVAVEAGPSSASPTPAASAAEAAAPADPAASDAAAVPFLPMPGAAASGASAASAPGAAASVPLLETVHSAPPVEPSASAAVQGPLQIRVSESSWIEVVDAGNRPLVSRTVQPGETLGLDGAWPLRLTIGNAAQTQVRLRGEPVDLTPHIRGNIAKLELR